MVSGEMGKHKFRLLPDVPIHEIDKCIISDDILDTNQFSDVLAEAAVNTSEPFTIGIFGPWGSGKSSLMRLMQKYIEREHGDFCVTVWFNAWQYEGEEILIIPLLASILKELNYKIIDKDEVFAARFLNLYKGFKSLLCAESLNKTSKVPLIGEFGIDFNWKAAISEFEVLAKELGDILEKQSMNFGLFDTIKRTSEESEGKIIIFVDDLDRCFPEKVLNLLKCMKLILNQYNITFVLGIEPKIIKEFVKTKYTKEFEIKEELYEDYLDKLVQMPFVLPSIEDKVEVYVESLLNNKNVFPEGFLDEDEIRAMKMITGPACKNNPRRIIRFLNRTLIMYQLFGVKNQSVKFAHFGVRNALEMHWEDVLKYIDDDYVYEIPSIQKGTFCFMLYKALKLSDKKQRELITHFKSLSGEDEQDTDSNILRQRMDKIYNDKFLMNLLKTPVAMEWLRYENIRFATQKAGQIVQKARGASKNSEYASDTIPQDSRNRDYKDMRLTGQSFKGFNFEKADLSGADLRRADMSIANFTDALMQRAELSSAILKSAFMSGADCSFADFSFANLMGADISAANLNGANFGYAKMNGANLKNAIMRNSDIRGADLSGADLRGVEGLTPCQLNTAVIDKATMLPEYINPDDIKCG